MLESLLVNTALFKVEYIIISAMMETTKMSIFDVDC